MRGGGTPPVQPPGTAAVRFRVDRAKTRYDSAQWQSSRWPID